MSEPVWQLIQDTGDYRDYQACIPDVRGYGVRLTLSKDNYSDAWFMSIVLDDTEGHIFHEKSFPVNHIWAERVTSNEQPNQS